MPRWITDGDDGASPEGYIETKIKHMSGATITPNGD